MQAGDGMKERIIQSVENRVEKENSLYPGRTTWRRPLIGFLSAADDRIPNLRNAVSPRHLLPKDILADAKTVVCFFIGFSPEIIRGNREGFYASEEWAVTYIRTNELISKIGDEIERLMDRMGHKVGKTKATHNFDEATLMSDWSHRHFANLAGLGTFGMNNMLITENGCCGRLGGFVTDLCLTPSRATTEENYLHKYDGSCGICRTRCVASAYSGNSYDRHTCFETCLQNAEYHREIGYADVCGKCLVGLPCSSGNPAKKPRNGIG